MPVTPFSFKLLDKSVLSRAIIEPPHKIVAPLENMARFVHIFNGKTKFYSPNHQYNLGTGDSLIMKSDNFINNWLPNDSGKSSEAIVIQFFPDIIAHIYDNKIPEFFSKSTSTNFESIERIPPSSVLNNFATSLQFYFTNPEYVTDDLIKIKIKELILILVNSDTSGKIKALLTNLFKSKEYEFKEIIHAHLYEDLGLEDLAYFAGMSLSSFKRKFKVVFDSSPRQYIIGKRLEKAKYLLDSTDSRVSDIAYDCGFNDLGYFSKTFASAFSLPPSEYRSTK